MLLLATSLSILATAQTGVGNPVPVSSLSGAAGSTSAASSATEPQLQARDQRYRIEPGDTFDVNFELSPEFNQQAVAVQPDGFVTLRGVGDVKVQGQSVPQLTETIRNAYSRILNNPIISIVLKDFQKPYFVADGQVAHPGKYDLRGDVTLTEAIAMAGGFTDSSKHSQVLLFRRVNAEWLSAQLINVKQMEKSGNLHEDPFIHPGDMLFVPKNTMSKISKFIPNTGLFKTY
jgi:polysaccharide export outer membrane protein